MVYPLPKGLGSETNGMIAIMAQWGLTAEELLPTIDKINKVADDYAVTSTDLVAGLTRSSGAAKVLGLTLNETIAILTTMREATGRTGKEVGNALNSILSFMQRDKAIKTFEGMGIKVFADEARTEFRNVIEIFDEMSAKWPQMGEAARDALTSEAEAAGLFSEEMADAVGMQEQWNDLQQRDLSQAAAGVYRRNFLLALLQNWSKVDEVLISQENSLGYSMKENERTMQTLEKQIEVLRASAEQLAVALGDAGLLDELKDLVEGVTDVIQWFNGLDDTMQTMLLTLAEVTLAVKLLDAALKLAGVSAVLSGGTKIAGVAALGSMAKNITSVGAAAAAAAGGVRALWTAFTGPVGILITMGTAIATIIRETSRASETLAEHGQIAEGLVGKYDSLTAKLQGLQSGTKEYESTAKELATVKGQIADAIPELIDGYDEETNSIKINRDEMGKMIDASKELKQATNELKDAHEAEMEQLRAQEQEHQKQGQYYSTQKGVVQDLDERRKKLTETLAKQKAGSEEAQKTEEALGETERLIGDIAEEAGLQRNAATDAIISKLEELRIAEQQGVLNTQQAELDKVLAVKEGALARLAIIQQEIASYGDAGSWGFGTAAGNFLKTINPLNYLNKDPRHLNLENLQKEQQKEAQAAAGAQAEIESRQKKIKDTMNSINAMQADIATGGGSSGGGGGSGGSSKKSDWLEAFIENTLTAAEAQARLNEQMEREISLANAENDFRVQSAMTFREYLDGLDAQSGLMGRLEEQQSGLHQENELYREAVRNLTAMQNQCNLTTEEGREAYKKLGDEIHKINGIIAENSEAWFENEKLQRADYGNRVQEKIDLMEKLVNMGALTKENELQYLAALELEKVPLEQRMELMQRILDTSKETLLVEIERQQEAEKAASEARIAGIQAEIDAIEQLQDEENELRQIEEARQAMTDARLEKQRAQEKLSNVQAERNTRIFQNGRWDYIADPQAVKDAQREVEDANQKLIKARESYYQTLEEVDQKHYIQQLEAQIEAEKKQQQENEKHWDEVKEGLDTFLTSTGEETDSKLRSIFDTLNISMGEKLGEMLLTVQEYVGQMKQEFYKLIEAQNEAGVSGGLLPMATGGPIPFDRAIQAHAGEYMLNAKDVSMLGGFSGVEAMRTSLRIPDAGIKSWGGQSSISQSDSHNVIVQNANFPNVVDASGLIRNLKQLAS